MKLELLDFIELENYPSGSGIEFYDDNIYVVGEKSRDLLVMGKKWNKPTLISLFDTTDKKKPVPVNSELESMTVLSVEKKPHLLIIGSGTAATKNKALLLNLKNNAMRPIDLSVFYNRIKAATSLPLNIEGVAEVYDYVVMVNRGTSNHLIITKPDFWKDQEKASLQPIVVDFDSAKLTPGKLGISGLTYSDKHEDLFLTISTEDNDPKTAGEKPGKNYLAIIENLYRKIGREKGKIKLNQVIDLSEADKRFEGCRIESVCVQSSKDHSIKLQLVGDDNNGKTLLFKVFLSW